jgi:hypothetical protein
MIDCPDNLLAQDIYVLHGRGIQDSAALAAIEQWEEVAFDSSCNVDRIVLMGHTSGAPLMARCVACEDSVVHDISSAVIFGGGRDANTRILASNGFHVRLSNYVSDLRPGANIWYRYGNPMDHYGDCANYGSVPGWTSCHSIAGLHIMGGGSQNSLSGCIDSSSGHEVIPDYYIRDTYWGNMKVGWGSVLYAGSSAKVAPPLFQLDRVLFQFAPGGGENTSFLTFDSGVTGSFADFRVNNVVFINDAESATRYDFARMQANGFKLDAVTFGPNIFATKNHCDSRALHLFEEELEVSTTCEVKERYEGIDGTSGWHVGNDFQRQGAAEGDHAGEDLAIIGWEGPYLAACDVSGSGACGYEDAMPRRTGIIAYTQAHGWATLKPVPSTVNGDPDWAEIPSLLQAILDGDGDGVSDVFETDTGVFVSRTDTGSDPGDADSDDDGLFDGAEVAMGSDPTDPDSDDDGYTDGEEVARGSDPTDPDSTPRQVQVPALGPLARTLAVLVLVLTAGGWMARRRGRL